MSVARRQRHRRPDRPAAQDVTTCQDAVGPGRAALRVPYPASRRPVGWMGRAPMELFGTLNDHDREGATCQLERHGTQGPRLTVDDHEATELRTRRRSDYACGEMREPRGKR